METLVKRNIGIACTPHIERITVMVKDALVIAKEDPRFDPYQNIIMYRYLRWTGHTAALRQLMTNPDLKCVAFFRRQGEVDEFLKNTPNGRSISSRCFVTGYTDLSKLRGLEIDVLIFQDYLYTPKDFTTVLEVNLPHIQEANPSIKAVMFLG